jgi:succinate-acetate transporter protein
MFVPAAAASAKLAAAAVMGLAGLRFLVTGAYELSASAAWKATAGWVGLLLGLVAVCSALGLALEAARGRAVLPLGRRQPVSGEPGVHPAL